MIDKKLVDLIIKETNPMEQGENLQNSNLGYGFLYYSYARLINAKKGVVIGSAKGFSVVSLSYAIRDNGGNRVTFIDPAIASESETSVTHGPMTNQIWLSQNLSKEHFSKFGLENIIKVIPKTNWDAFTQEEQFINSEPIDILIIDGLHTREGVKYDLENFGRLLKPNGIAFIHDTNRIFPDLSNYVYTEIPERSYDMMSLNIQVGLTILRKRTNCLKMAELKDEEYETVANWGRTENLPDNILDGCKEYGVYHNEKLVGCFGLWSDESESILRGVVVREDYRKFGVGDFIVDSALLVEEHDIILWTENERWIKHLYYYFDAEKGEKILKQPFFGNLDNNYCWKVKIPYMKRGIDFADKRYYRNG